MTGVIVFLVAYLVVCGLSALAARVYARPATVLVEAEPVPDTLPVDWLADYPGRNIPRVPVDKHRPRHAATVGYWDDDTALWDFPRQLRLSHIPADERLFVPVELVPELELVNA